MDRVDPNRNPHSNHLTALAQAARALERRAGYANARMLQAECHMVRVRLRVSPNPVPDPNPTPKQAECHMELAEFSEAAAAY